MLAHHPRLQGESGLAVVQESNLKIIVDTILPL
jgi:hypothetical protein